MSNTSHTVDLPSAALKKARRKVPDYLVRETLLNQPFYYPGYRDVLNKTKTIEELMADSTLQWTLKEQIGDQLKAGLDSQRYRVGRGEVGVHLGPNENVGVDIAVFDRAVFSANQIGTKYAQVAPLLVVEIDVNVESSEKPVNLFEDYVMVKITRLLQFGVQRFLWVFTKSRTVFVARPNAHWYFVPWDQNIELMEGISCNVAALLAAEGIDLKLL